MRSRLLFAIPVSLAPLVALAVMLPSGGQTTHKRNIPAFEQTTAKFFAKNCVVCHEAKTKAGGINLLSLAGADSVTKNRDTWESVLREIRTGQMPPQGSPRLTPTESKTITASIDSELGRIDKINATNPGRVTAHRLNRAEYNNTIRDLLGVDFQPADDFPQDDSGYGFDNIGDVLSLSSSQMERYVLAAEKIARTAVFGQEKMQPTMTEHEVSGRNIEQLMKAPAIYDASGLLLRNSLHMTHRFSADGEYLIRFKLNGVRPLGSDPLHLALWVDGKKLQSQDFDPTGSAAFNPDRQDFSSRTVDFRMKVPSGEHWIAAVIERMYEGLPPQYEGLKPSKKVLPKPEFKVPPNFPPERVAQFKKFFEARQKEKVSTGDARVSSLEIGGPYQQTTAPSTECLKKIFVCGHVNGKHQPGCARKIVAEVGNRAFRRPMTASEIDRFSNLVGLAQRQGDSFEEGVCLALQGILVSPHFLYRIERDGAKTEEATGHLISQYELASRLSYFLWSSMPDATLRKCADSQTLRNPEVLKAQIQRLLKAPQSRALAENFGGQWLQFRALESVHPDKVRFPDFDDYLRMSMRRETEMFLNDIIREDKSILNLLDGKYSFLNEKLAKFYGVSGVEGPNFRRVDLAGTQRGGILTQASVLTVTSYANRTSPVLRGKWILENILNAPTPPPPPGVPNLDVSTVGSGASLRQQLEQHRKNPTCASCHSRMDPLGFGLENFDAVGAFRSTEGKIAIDSTGTLPGGKSFSGAEGLRSILKSDQNAFTECLASKLLTYALGRGLERYDRPTVQEIAKKLARNDYRFSNLVWQIVNSRPFQMRRGDRVP